MNSEKEREALIDRVVETAEEGNWPEFDDAIGKLRAALSTEAQPEVTGAVAWIHPFDLGRTCEVSAHQESDEHIPLYTAEAIQAAVREKLEQAALIAEAYREVTDGQSMYIADKIRALMESPQPSLEEPAN